MWRIHDADTGKPLTRCFMHQPARTINRLHDLIAQYPHRDFFIGDDGGRPVPKSRLEPFAQLARSLSR